MSDNTNSIKEKNSKVEKSSSADYLDLNKEISFFESSCDDLLLYAKKAGVSEVEVGVSKDIGLSVSVRNSQIETLEYNRDNSFGITVYQGQRKGTATTSDLSVKALHDAVDAAINIAKYTQQDPCAGLADKGLMATTEIDLNLDHPMGIDASAAKEFALDCESFGLEFDNKISNSEGATFSSHRNIRYYANSHGFTSATPSTRHSLSCVLLAEDTLGKQRDHWYTIARDANLLETAKMVGSTAAKRTISRLGSRKLKTQKAKVLFSPEMARTLIGHLKSAISGTNLYRKASFLAGAKGKKILPDFVSMKEKPFIEKGLASAWCDSEGVATKEQYIVENGCLNTYLLSSYSARKLNSNPTGHAGGIHNLCLSDSGIGLKDLLLEMSTGLLVTEMMGQGVNLLTGDFSRGASGFWVEKGEIQFFVQEITVAGNLNEMYANLIAIGNDFDRRSSVLTGSWLVPEMTIAGN